MLPMWGSALEEKLSSVEELDWWAREQSSLFHM